MKRLFQIIALCLLVVLVVLGGLVFQFTHKKGGVLTHVSTPPSVSIQYFKPQMVPLRITTYGSTVSSQSVDISAKQDGTIKAIYVKAGETVKAGQRLFQIDSTAIDDQLASLKASEDSAYATYQAYKKSNENMPGLIAAVDLASAKADYLSGKSAYESAKATTFLTSPIDGVVSDTNWAVGSTVLTDDLLVSVTAQDPLQLKYTVPSQYSEDVKVGQSVQFTPNHSKATFAAHVTYVSPALDASLYTLTLRAQLDPSEDLNPNRFGVITQVVSHDYPAFIIPQSLVSTDEKGFYVFIVSHSKVAKQYIETQRLQSDGNIIVTKGLSDQLAVITSDHSQLDVGVSVTFKDQVV